MESFHPTRLGEADTIAALIPVIAERRAARRDESLSLEQRTLRRLSNAPDLLPPSQTPQSSGTALPPHTPLQSATVALKQNPSQPRSARAQHTPRASRE